MDKTNKDIEIAEEAEEYFKRVKTTNYAEKIYSTHSTSVQISQFINIKHKGTNMSCCTQRVTQFKSSK